MLLRNITHFSLWENFTSNFPNLTTIEISNDLMNLREIDMPAFIDYVHNYRKVDEHGGSISSWSFVVMIFGTCVFILMLIFMYKKCFHEKVKVYFGERLADCCGNKNVVTSSFCQLLRMGWCRRNMTRLLGANREGTFLPHQTRRS